MEFSVTNNLHNKTAVFVVPIFQDLALSKQGPEILKIFLTKREERKDFLGKEGEALIHLPDENGMPEKVILWGMGLKKALNATKVREQSALIAKAVKTFKKGEFTMYCPESFVNFGQALGEGFCLGNYNIAKFKTGKEKDDLELQSLKKITLISAKAPSKFQDQLKKGALIAEAVGEVRDMVNAGPAYKNVEYLANKAQAIAKQNGYRIKVLNKSEMGKLGMFGILGVNKGSANGAKMVVMEYSPKGSAKKPPVVIIGKGIIFDSGGYNLKPSHSLFEMQLDMAGAGAVMGLFMLLKKLNVGQPVVGIFPLTDNLVSATSQKPSDVVKTYSGKTVEIVNTDAEGRMILCDALTYALKHFDPRYVIDMATLTGACMVALGDRYAGLFGNDSGLIEKLRKAGEETDELTWPMPIHPDHSAKMKSKIADLRNWDEVPYAGASKGAAFLQEFVEDAKWAHIDIAGPAFVKDPKKYESPMGTGFGVRLCLEFLENLR